MGDDSGKEMLELPEYVVHSFDVTAAQRERQEISETIAEQTPDDKKDDGSGSQILDYNIQIGTADEYARFLAKLARRRARLERRKMLKESNDSQASSKDSNQHNSTTSTSDKNEENKQNYDQRRVTSGLDKKS